MSTGHKAVKLYGPYDWKVSLKVGLLIPLVDKRVGGSYYCDPVFARAIWGTTWAPWRRTAQNKALSKSCAVCSGGLFNLSIQLQAYFTYLGYKRAGNNLCRKRSATTQRDEVLDAGCGQRPTREFRLRDDGHERGPMVQRLPRLRPQRPVSPSSYWPVRHQLDDVARSLDTNTRWSSPRWRWDQSLNIATATAARQTVINSQKDQGQLDKHLPFVVPYSVTVWQACYQNLFLQDQDQDPGLQDQTKTKTWSLKTKTKTQAFKTKTKTKKRCLKKPTQ